MRRRGSASIVANPVLVGAVTTLVVVVAVFLSYNANNGLPFVPTRQLDVLLPNGSELVKGNEIREGGFRVGVITKMTPVRDQRTGKVVAKLILKLDKTVGALPVDSRVVVRERSALGLKYLELDRGTARSTLPDGATLPARQATIPVDLDQIFNMFDQRTRTAEANNLVTFGSGLAGRGVSLNEFIQTAPALLGVLQPVMANLSDPRTQLANFFDALDRTVRVVAPVSQTFAHGFTSQADTFQAIDNDPAALKATITKSPGTMDAFIRSAPDQRVLLNDLVPFSRDLAAAARQLPVALPIVSKALEVGTGVSRRTVPLNNELRDTLSALDQLVTAPPTNGSLRGLSATVATLQPQLRFLGPYVTGCNDWNFFWTFLAEHLSHKVPTGTAERVLLNTQGQQTDSVGAQGAVLPAAGKNVEEGTPQYVHQGGYPPAISANGALNCGSGQQGYITGYNPFAVIPKNESRRYRFIATQVAGVPVGPVGPTYRQIDKNGHGVGLNPNHLPAGETFTPDAGGTGVNSEKP